MAEASGDLSAQTQNGVHSADTSSNIILDSSRDPYERLKTSSSTETDCVDNVAGVTRLDTLVKSVQNGDAALLEIAVEAEPDLVFESDLVSCSQAQLPPNVRPRVYLERESFNCQNNDSSLPVNSLVSSIFEAYKLFSLIPILRKVLAWKIQDILHLTMMKIVDLTQ